MAQQHGLGRGLASLIPPKKLDENTEIAKASSLVPDAKQVSFDRETGLGKILEISVEAIAPNPHQPRLHFNEEKLGELSQSIQEHGILQPLIVTERDGRYELIAGERRFQAAKLAGLKMVPVIVRKAEEQEKFELAIIENVQRHDLNPLEEARAYHRLIEEFGLSQESVAKKMGKSRSAIANVVRLLHLPVDVQRAVAEGKISEGHAKALLSIENPEKQRALFDLILKSGLTVRETELKAREVSVKPHKRLVTIDPLVREKEDRLAEIFGTKVRISRVGKGGKIVIEYYGDEDLTHLVAKLSGTVS